MPDPLSLFEGYGIEIEYALVDRETLAVRPVADRILERASGRPASDHDDGDIAWSNELALHVIELKTNGPAPRLEGVDAAFQASLGRLVAVCEAEGVRPMPTAMHPWMDPRSETHLWPHEYGDVYRAYDAVFDCHSHGWTNVQSTHLNLPFADEDEFGRLMAAVRLVLPLLPALAASSPVAEGRPTGLLDTRLDHYRRHALRVPSLTGQVVPERVFEYEAYRELVLAPIRADLSAVDSSGMLAGNEWANARGAIARFDRQAVEIRLVDVQECPRADLAIAAAVVDVVRALVEERSISREAQMRFPSEPLVALLDRTIAVGPAAEVGSRGYTELLGCSRASTAGDLWRELIGRTYGGPTEYGEVLERILDHGTLAERILASIGDRPSPDRLREVYRDLCDCLAAGHLFEPVRSVDAG